MVLGEKVDERLALVNLVDLEDISTIFERALKPDLVEQLFFLRFVLFTKVRLRDCLHSKGLGLGLRVFPSVYEVNFGLTSDPDLFSRCVLGIQSVRAPHSLKIQNSCPLLEELL